MFVFIPVWRLRQDVRFDCVGCLSLPFRLVSNLDSQMAKYFLRLDVRKESVVGVDERQKPLVESHRFTSG